MDLAQGQIKEKALKDGGFSDEEIDQWKSQTASDLQTGGFSGQEVRDYFGQKNFDGSDIKNTVSQNVKAQATATDGTRAKREPIDASVKPVEAKDIWDAMAVGWGNSVLGLAINKGKSPLSANPNAGTMDTAMSAAGQMSGDLPFMIPGAVAGEVLGAGAGAATGNLGAVVPGAIAGSAAGAFALPNALRKSLIDHYDKGDITSAKDFADRVVGTTWEGAKGAIVGAASAVTGGFGGALAGTVGRLAGEVLAQTTVSSALEGHLPEKKDFINGAIAIGGLHAAGLAIGKMAAIPSKLANIYSKTGSMPAETIEASSNDPTLKGEILSQNPDLPIEAKPDVPPDKVFPNATNPPDLTIPPKEETTAKAPEARAEILSRIGEQKENDDGTIVERAKDSLDKGVSQYLDYTKAVANVIKEIGDQPLNDKNAHVLMRLHAAVNDKVREFVETGTRDFNTGEINGESYMSVINDIKKDLGESGIDDVNAYRISARSLELQEEGKTQTGDRANDKAFVDANPQLKKYADRILNVRNKTLDYLGASGRYSDKQIDAMKEFSAYTPLKKIMETDQLTGSIPGDAKSIQRIGSSDLQIVNPIASDLKDLSMMIRLANETHATNTFIDNMSESEDPSIYFRRSENQKGLASATQIAGYEDGQRTLYDVPKDVADSIKAMAGNRPAMSVWTTLLKPFASALRLGTVNNPLFALRHAWRNQLTAPTLTQTGLKPFEALLYAPKYFEKGDSYHNFVYDGGATNSIIDMGEGYLDGKIFELDKKAPILQKAWNTIKTAAEVSHVAIVANDNVIRFAEYSRMLDKGATRTEAAFAAREVLPDFQKAGLQRSAIQQITAFLNVHAQGLTRMGEETINNPLGYIAKNLAYITVPSILLSVAQRDDDAIKDLPAWQRYNYWAIHTSNWRPANTLSEAMSVKEAYPSNVRQLPGGDYEVNDGTIWRMQKPFTNGILFGSAVEASIDAWRKKDPSAFEDFAKNVIKSAIVEPVPTGLSPVIEQYENRSFYTGQPIVGQSMENKLPEVQYDRYTSETAKVLGKILSYVPLIKDIGPQDARLTSPKVIDNYMHSWGGTLGYYAVDVADKGLVAAGIAPKTVKPTETLADIPFVKEFVIRFPSARPESVSQFEDRYKMADQIKNSINFLLKQGDVQGAVKLQSRYELNMERLQGADKAIKNMNATIQKAYQNPDIDPTQKRQIIDSLMFGMVSISKEGNKLMDEFENKGK